MGRPANTTKKRLGGREKTDRLHLTGIEVQKLIDATKGKRNEARDRCLLLLMFRHGLRVSEACGLSLDQVTSRAACCMSFG